MRVRVSRDPATMPAAPVLVGVFGDRAFDSRTGALTHTFDDVPPPPTSLVSSVLRNTPLDKRLPYPVEGFASRPASPDVRTSVDMISLLCTETLDDRPMAVTVATVPEARPVEGVEEGQEVAALQPSQRLSLYPWMDADVFDVPYERIDDAERAALEELKSEYFVRWAAIQFVFELRRRVASGTPTVGCQSTPTPKSASTPDTHPAPRAKTRATRRGASGTPPRSPIRKT